MEHFLFTEKNKRSVSLILTLAGMLILSLIIFVLFSVFNMIEERKYIGADIEPQATITASGEASIFVVPDVAEFTFSVQFEASEVPEAQNEVAQRMSAITEYLEEEGIEERNIRTTGYSVRPRYEHRTVEETQIDVPTEREEDAAVFEEREMRARATSEERVLVGYEVTQTTNVKVTDMDAAGRLVGGVGERGATNVSNVSFSVEDEDELKRGARAQAIADARSEAAVLAHDLGVTLVRIVNFQETSAPSFPPYRMESLDAADSAPEPEFAPGEEEIVSEVQIQYEIR